MRAAGFRKVTVSPRFVYVDASRPTWVEGFTYNTYIAMVEGVREQALAAKMIARKEWQNGIADLKASAGPGGVFCYTFFKAVKAQLAFTSHTLLDRLRPGIGRGLVFQRFADGLDGVPVARGGRNAEVFLDDGVGACLAAAPEAEDKTGRGWRQSGLPI